MNRYSPYYDPDEQRTQMSIDAEGSWVHVTYAEQLHAQRDEARAEVERLRALLAEACNWAVAVQDDSLRQRIDAALAEPVVTEGDK